MNYKEYLASREWAILREQVRNRSGNRCERCYARPQEAVHHLTYERLGNELLEDLQAICTPCHEFLSGKSNVDPNEFCRSEKPRRDAAAQRERKTVALILSKPNAYEEIKDLLRAESIRDPDLKLLLLVFYANKGKPFAVNSERLEKLIIELHEEAPKGEECELAFADLKRLLISVSQKQLTQLTNQQLSPQATDADHLYVLRQLRERSPL